MDELDKDDVEAVERAAEALREQFDTVQIIVTRHEGGDPQMKDSRGTLMIQSGRGNWYARYASVVVWLKKEDADIATTEELS